MDVSSYRRFESWSSAPYLHAVEIPQSISYATSLAHLSPLTGLVSRRPFLPCGVLAARAVCACISRHRVRTAATASGQPIPCAMLSNVLALETVSPVRAYPCWRPGHRLCMSPLCPCTFADEGAVFCRNTSAHLLSTRVLAPPERRYVSVRVRRLVGAVLRVAQRF